MRKSKAKKRTPSPDPRYGDSLVTLFVNNLMMDGKKSKSFKQTRSTKAPTMKFKSKIAKKSNPASNRNIRLNKSVKPKSKSRRKVR